MDVILIVCKKCETEFPTITECGMVECPVCGEPQILAKEEYHEL